ncbi:MAG: hydroxymethylbilane synthase [Leucobacter sp.]
MTTQIPAEHTPNVHGIPVLEGPVAPRDGLIRIGTRGSKLAVTQTSGVARAIALATGAEVVLVIVKTFGDVTTAPLSQLGGTGVFVSALREALLRGDCDLAVHSLKDLPTAPCPGIVLGAVPQRADARDALVSRGSVPLADLPTGARVGTGSPRRVAQLLARRPDLEICDLRGNVDTRMARVENDLDAVVLAAAGLERIGREDAIAERFSLDTAPAAPGQGALAVEARAADHAAGVEADPAGDATRTAASHSLVAEALTVLDDAHARACALAERALLATLEAGCAAPVGAWGRIDGERLLLTGSVYSLDGQRELSVTLDREWAIGFAGLDEADGTGDGIVVGGADERARELGAAAARALLDDGARELAPLGDAR